MAYKGGYVSGGFPSNTLRMASAWGLIPVARHNLNGRWYTPNELSEISGIAPATIRDRLRRGYSVEEAVKVTATSESVTEFADASWWEDWVGMPISDLFKIYWGWAVSHGYSPIQIQGFSRQLFKMYPNLKTVPIKKDGKCFRVIRLR